MRSVWNLFGYVVGMVLVLVCFAIALAVPVALVYAMYEAFPRQEIEPRPGEGWLDTVFANRFVIFSARVVLIGLALVLLIGAIYLSVSIFYRIYRKEFLHKAGPFEAAVRAATDRDLEGIGETYQSLLADAWAENEDLERRLAVALEVIAEHDLPLPEEPPPLEDQTNDQA